MPDIYFLEFDDENEMHIARHNVAVSEVRQLLENRHVTAPNPKHADRPLLIGETHGGRVLVVSLAPTSDEATWRPLTARDAEPEERKVFERCAR